MPLLVDVGAHHGFAVICESLLVSYLVVGSPHRANSMMRAVISSLAELSSCNFNFSHTASRSSTWL
jgi:hypothetical protein